MAIGMANAGFRHAAVIEWNSDACETFRENQRHHARHIEQWPLHETDVRKFDYGTLSGDVMVVSGGPPCQPFSMGGKHKGYMDERDMFPEAVRAVRELRPKAFIFENVKGLKRETFATYFEYIRLQLSYPSILRKKDEAWREHCRRLEKHETSSRIPSEYRVVSELLNAADYGVPQKRERVLIVGFRADLGVEWSFPEETHSDDALLESKWIAGDYWDRHEIAKKHRPKVEGRLATRLEKIRSGDLFADRQARDKGNAGFYPAARVQMEERIADEWAAMQYQTALDVWKTQGHAPCGAIRRAIYGHILVPLFATRKSTVMADLVLAG
jgi:DNA (cytosine-5)-methyltransferase 1